MYRLLIIDDEEILINSMRNFLSTHFELEIHVAYSAFEAMHALRRTRFDLIMTDISMPAMDGLELLEFVRRYWPECHVIILTAHNSFDYVYRAIQFGRVDYLLKVEDYEVIRRTVERNLEQITLERAHEQFYASLGERIAQMTPHLRNDLLDRVLRRRMPLPDADELSSVGLTLLPDEPVLLALGAFSGERAEALKLLQTASHMVERSLRARNLEPVTHFVENRAVWLIQRTAQAQDQPHADVYAYVHEMFDKLPQSFIKQADLTLVLADAFVPWPSVPDTFEKASLYMDRFNGEQGMITVPDLPQDPRPDGRRWPGIEALADLWTLLNEGNGDLFLAKLRENLGFLRGIDDLQAALPLPAVAAVTLLVSEAAQAFAPACWDEPKTQRLLRASGYATGAQWLEEILPFMKSLFDLRAQGHKTLQLQLVDEVNAYLREHYAQDITLTKIASVLHYNPSYLSRVYSEVTGTKLMSHLKALRIDQAKVLLRDTTLPLPEIARLCGFYATKYFTQVFKKEMDLSPSEYRQKG